MRFFEVMLQETAQNEACKKLPPPRRTSSLTYRPVLDRSRYFGTNFADNFFTHAINRAVQLVFMSLTSGGVVMKGTQLVYTTLMLTAMISFAVLVFQIVVLFLG